MDRFMITAAQIICVICMLVPAAVLVIGKVRKRALEVDPFLKGFGICFGICLIAVFVLFLLAVVDIVHGVLFVLLYSAMLLCLYNVYRYEFYTQAVSFYLGTMQFASLLCSVPSFVVLVDLAELYEGHSEHCDCYYERQGEFGSAEQCIIAALIRAVIVCLMSLAIKKINLSEKLSNFKKAAASALISTVLCVPIDIFIIWM